MRYDPFGMMSLNSGREESYVYTADDERIASAQWQSAEWRWRWTLRDLSAKPVREYESWGRSGNQDFLWVVDHYHSGRVIAAEREAAEGGRRHFHVDHLGTPRIVTNASAERISTHAYFPFGEEVTSLLRQRARGWEHEEPLRFTGHERDGLETTATEDAAYLDYMHARYYGPKWGRFLSVDPVLDIKRSVKQPQSWNRYSYVINNPVNRIDPDGRVDQNWDGDAARQLFPNDRRAQLEWEQSVANKTAVAAVAVVAGIALSEIAVATTPIWMPLAIRAQPLINRIQNFFSGETGTPTPTIGGFSAAASAVGKAEATASKFGMGGGELVKSVMANGGKFVDQSNGTVNVFMARPDGKAGFVRVTLDASNKVVSVGLNQARDVRDGLLSGRYRLYNY